MEQQQLISFVQNDMKGNGIYRLEEWEKWRNETLR